MRNHCQTPSGLFPEFNQVFKNICGMTSLDVLALCPAPKTITGMKLEKFVDTIRKRFKGRAPKVQKLHAIYSLPQASAGIETGADSVSLELSFLVQRLRLFTEQIERLEETLVRLVKSIPDARYLLSIVGISYISVVGILAELGPLGYYQSAGQLIKMAGTNPIEGESAGKRGSHTPMSKKVPGQETNLLSKSKTKSSTQAGTSICSLGGDKMHQAGGVTPWSVFGNPYV